MNLGGMKRPELQALCKRHGLPAGGTNADLVARLDAALSGGAEAEEEVVVGVVTRKGCLKRPVGDGGEAKKVTFAVQQTRGRRLRSRVVWSPVVSKTRGKRAEAGADSAADDGISVDACANVPVRRSRRNSLIAADAEEIEAAVTVDRKRKCKDQEIAEDVAANAQVVPSRRVTRRSSLLGNAVLLPPAVEKKMGREKAADGKNKLAAEEQVAEAQDSSAATAVVENKRSRRKRENCEPDVQKSAKVEVPSRTTRSRSVEAVVMSPTVVENKRRKTGDERPDIELPTVSEVVKKDAPVTRSLRNRVVQVNNLVVEETCTSQQLENKAQPSRPATQDAEKQPIVKEPVRRSTRKSVVSTMLDSEDKDPIEEKNPEAHVRRSTRRSIVPAKDVKGVCEEIQHAKGEDAVKQPAITEPVRRSTRKSVVSTTLDSEHKDPTEEKIPEAPIRRSMRRSVVAAKDVKGAGEEIQHAKGEDGVRQPAITEPVRRSTRKSLASAMHEKEENDLIAEKNPEAPVRRSMRRSVVPAKDVKGAGEEIQHAKGEDAVKQPAITEPVRRSTRKSLASAMHEEENDLIAEKNPGAYVRRSSRKSVVPVKDVGEDIQNTKGEAEFAVGDGEGQSPVAGHGTDTASGSALPTSDNNLEIHCDVITEESIRADDLGRCPSMDGKGNLLTNLHSEGAAYNSILPALNAAKGCSSDERHSSFGLEVMFTEACKDTAVEVDGGNKSITCLTPGFHVGSDCGLEDEDFTKEDCSIAEKNMRLVADNTDEEATIQVQQDGVQEGDPEKPSLFSATPKCKRECGLPEETVLHSKNQGCSSSAEQSPFGLESLSSQESIEKSVEYDALATSVHTEIGFDELKECHVKRALENAHVSEPHHDTDEGSCPVSKNVDFMCTSQQGNGIEGLLKVSHDEEWVSIKEGTNSEEVACKGEGSDKLVHCDDPEPSSEKTDVNEQAADNAYGVSEVVLSLSSTLHAPANENYDACLGSNIGLTHQGHKDQCSEDTEEQFASKTWSNDIFEGATSKYIECGDLLLPAEERSHSQDDQLNSKLEGTKVVESGCNFSKDFSTVLDNGSVVGIVGERTPPGSDLPKDLSTEYNINEEHLDGPAAEIFLDGSTTYGGANVSRVDASFSLATSSKHGGALSEEAVHTMKKYAGACSSNPRELLMDLQSPLSKEKIEESISHDGLAFPSAESSGNKLVDVEQGVEVHLCSNLSQLESTDQLDELIGCSKTEVLLQGHNDRRSEDREEQVASRYSADDILEAAAAKYIESGAVMLPSEERSNLKDGKLNPKQESTIVMESGLSCNNDVANTLGIESVVDIVSQRTPSGSGLQEDYCTDYNLQQDFLDGCSVESSLQGSTTVCRKKNVSGVAGTIENPSFSLATTDYKHDGALSEEAAHKLKDYTGTCSEDPKHLVIELQSLFSEASVEKSVSHDDLAFPSAESGINEPTVCHFEKQIDTLVSSEPDTYQGSCHDLSRAEEKGSCISTSVQHNESGGSLRSSHMKDLVTSAHINFSDDAHLIERNIVVEEVLCEEKEKGKSFPTSDSDVLQSNSNEYGPCQTGQQCIHGSSSMQVTSNIEAFNHDPEESNENNEGQMTPGIPASNMSEDAGIERSEREIGLPPAAGISALPDEQLKHPSDLSAPRTPEESVVLQYCFPGSEEICESTRRVSIDGLRAELQCFKFPAL